MSTQGGPGGSTYTVHYRRKDGTEASGRAERNDRGGFSWIAPEDCAAITGITEIGGGGAGATGWGGGEDGGGRIIGEYGAQDDGTPPKVYEVTIGRDARTSEEGGQQ